MSYTALALVGVAAAATADLFAFRVRLLRRKAFWAAYAIIVGFQLLVNGVLTGFEIVRYDPDAILGPRVVYAPVEDLLFGFALVLWTLDWWVWWGRREARPPGRDGAGGA
ncbi:lycopene cyclase domain-containing protein [Frankia nepalensis]|uniref:Lycopene cyclase domain-containing protein n=1 Tax=Frankia nepalensis TaxID=1836974 RepID=A0A937RK51_9ACTN|nr:lycopene cyclase domain-containing protein [Frankia nepalensis]MBL7501152.1 lycopene cyclase domain-containing protein [Frankia nepalensis]MBL7513758.1 lycopene cyclase domain-containing protein [Frankia nepalensis]MBL7631642.1 lycopene cyclase domain-containing protein [Frankia nepalensis]